MTRKRDPARPSAVHGMLIEGEGFHDLPFGGHAGELSPAAPATPTPAPLQPLAIEPPVDAMKLATSDGFDPPPPGPPEVVEPLVRWAPPPPDWREEEERLATESDAAEPEPPQSAEATPNLDAVKNWRKGAP